ncbi:MAG: kelch repeat-containing protein [bacterium]|nr:kelch repeat-containing protein [bacterium]
MNRLASILLLFCFIVGDEILAESWESTGSLNRGRSKHIAILLQNGKVLVAGGGSGPSSGCETCELYDTTTGTLDYTGNMNYVRTEHCAVRLNDGKVLVIGGADTSIWAPRKTCEFYNPSSGTWSLTDSLKDKRGSPCNGIVQSLQYSS